VPEQALKRLTKNKRSK